MSVKVMIAPAIVAGDLKAVRKPRVAQASAPRKKRSAVYDAEGNEVFITLMCLKCHKTRPLAQFGLRKMADGAVRNQPWCRGCRSGSGAEKSDTPEAVAEIETATESAPREPVRLV